MKEKVKVSACLIAYNQEDHIRECIEGVLNQKLNVAYEIVIGDDCSTDGTAKICESYQERFPDLIKYNKRSKNLGMIGNWVKTIQDCSGEYIGLCEGDDYWTDPLKLQKQVDFLEANPDYAICFHKVKVLKDGEFLEEEVTEKRYQSIHTRPINVNNLIEQGNFMHTPSVVFRNYKLNFPFEFKHSTVGDYFLHIINAQNGFIKRLDDKMAVYRQGVGTFSSILNSEMHKRILIYESCILSYLRKENQKKILLKKHIENINNVEDIFLNKHLSNDFLAVHLSFKNYLKILLKKIILYFNVND